MEDSVQRLCLFLVFQPRIQASLDRTRQGWNFHKVRTAGNKTPTAMWNLSRTEAISHGYWTGDPGDSFEVAEDPLYGCDGAAPFPPEDELAEDPAGLDAHDAAGTELNENADIEHAKDLLGEFDFEEDDGNWGIEVYIKAVSALYEQMATLESESDSDNSE